MGKALVVLATGLSFAALCTAAGAQQLPKSGSISWHTGWKFVGEVMTVADKHLPDLVGVRLESSNHLRSRPRCRPPTQQILFGGSAQS